MVTVGWKVITGAYFKVRSYFTRVSDFQLQSSFLMPAVSSAQKYKPLQSSGTLGRYIKYKILTSLTTKLSTLTTKLATLTTKQPY